MFTLAMRVRGPTWPPPRSHTPVRDRALLLIGFASAFRRRELGAFGVSAPPPLILQSLFHAERLDDACWVMAG
jgi:hypothetical protein